MSNQNQDTPTLDFPAKPQPDHTSESDMSTSSVAPASSAPSAPSAPFVHMMQLLLHYARHTHLNLVPTYQAVEHKLTKEEKELIVKSMTQ